MSAYILPVVIILIFLFSMRKTHTYSAFISGAQKGMKTVVGIFPPILAIMTVTAMLNESGTFDIFLKLISPLTDFLKIPDEIMPLTIVRPFSGGAALGALSQILSENDPDGVVSFTAAVMMGSTETTFYTLSVYFQKTRVKYTKKIIPAAVIGDIVGLIAAVWVCKIIF